MKRTIFDNASDIPYYVDDNSIYEKTGVDFERIKKGVHKKLSIKNTGTRLFSVKKLFLVAAVVIFVIGVFSLPVVAENMYGVYCSVVGGDEYAMELTNAKDTRVSVGDPNLRIDSVKICGDDNISNLIEITLSQKNGRAFIDREFSDIKPGSFDAYIDSEGAPFEAERDLELIIDDGISENGDKINALGYKALYGTEDNGKRLRILINIRINVFLIYARNYKYINLYFATIN